MAVSSKPAGSFAGRTINEFTLTSATGVEVAILEFGVVVRDWRVPAPEGQRSVVLGFDSFAPYPEHSPYFGAIVGRVANRIGGASFELDGATYTLPANDGRNALHGGPDGLGRQIWHGETDSAGNAVRFTHHSPDGAMGFPGAVHFEAIYRLNGNRLRLDLSARPDRRTPISLCQHQYFNLDGSPTVLDHIVQVDAPAYTELDRALIPTGAILPVDGTPYDLRRGRTLRQPDGTPIDYDLNLILATGRDRQQPVAIVQPLDRSVTLRLWTSQPGIQFYNGVWTYKVEAPGAGGRHFVQHAGLCLEDQMFPDAVHHAHFPSIIRSPDDPYQHWNEIEIAAG